MKKHPQNFPGVLEIRKSTGDYGILFTVPLKHLEHIKPLLEKEGRPFFVSARDTADIEQAEELVKNADNGRVPVQEHAGAAKETSTVSVDKMAEIFDMTARRVEQLEKDGVFYKLGHNRYDLLRSAAGYVQDRKTRNKTSVLNQRREENLEKKNRELDRQHAIEMGKLVSAADMQRNRELENANIRQKFIYLPALAPQLEGRPVGEIEARLKEYMRKALEDLDRSDNETRGHGDGEMEQEQSPVQAPKKKKKKKKR